MFKWSRVSVTRMSSLSNENGFTRPARIPYKVLYALLFTLIVVIIVLLLPSELTRRSPQALFESNTVLVKELDYALFEFNSTYPLTTPTSKLCCEPLRHSIIPPPPSVLHSPPSSTTMVVSPFCAICGGGHSHPLDWDDLLGLYHLTIISKSLP